MVDIIYPKSDEIFYVMRVPPTNDYAWNLLRGSALILAESGNLLMMGDRSIDQDGWVKNAKVLVDVGTAAFEAGEVMEGFFSILLGTTINPLRSDSNARSASGARPTD
jgi:hypothetical protein